MAILNYDFPRGNEGFSLEEYLAILGANKAAGGYPPREAPLQPQGLQSPSPASTEQYYRGMSEGVPSYTNIPEVAAQRGLQRFDLAPPVAQVGGVEMYGTSAENYPGPTFGGLAAAQKTGAFQPPVVPVTFPEMTGDLMKDWQKKREIYTQVLNKGQQLRKSPEEIQTELKHRGITDFDPFTPPTTKKADFITAKESEIIYQQIPGGLKPVAWGGEKKEEEKWEDWGYGKKRNLSTGQIVDIAVKPEKGTAEETKTTDAKSRVAGNLTSLRDLYDSLDKMGAIPSTGKGTFENVIARVASSGMGQAAAAAIGSEAQSIRNQINQMRPLLINDIRQAAQMGSKGMDSEKELAFYLQAATDPARDVQANRKALNVLSAAFGLGDEILSAEARAAKMQEVQKAKAEAKKAGLNFAEQPGAPGGAKTVSERRTLPDGRTIVMYSDGSKGIE